MFWETHPHVCADINRPLSNHHFNNNLSKYETNVGADINRPPSNCHFNNNLSKHETNVGADIIRPPSNRHFNNDLSKHGKIVDTAINSIPKYYPFVSVEIYAIMPDHIHLILKISHENANKNHTVNNGRIISAPTVNTIIGQMKRWVSKEIGVPIWQKSFYDRILRNEDEYLQAAEYIFNNPMKWEYEHNTTVH